MNKKNMEQVIKENVSEETFNKLKGKGKKGMFKWLMTLNKRMVTLYNIMCMDCKRKGIKDPKNIDVDKLCKDCKIKAKEILERL